MSMITELYRLIFDNKSNNSKIVAPDENQGIGNLTDILKNDQINLVAILTDLKSVTQTLPKNAPNADTHIGGFYDYLMALVVENSRQLISGYPKIRQARLAPTPIKSQINLYKWMHEMDSVLDGREEISTYLESRVLEDHMKDVKMDTKHKSNYAGMIINDLGRNIITLIQKTYGLASDMLYEPETGLKTGYRKNEQGKFKDAIQRMFGSIFKSNTADAYVDFKMSAKKGFDMDETSYKKLLIINAWAGYIAESLRGDTILDEPTADIIKNRINGYINANSSQESIREYHNVTPIKTLTKS